MIDRKVKYTETQIIGYRNKLHRRVQFPNIFPNNMESLHKFSRLIQNYAQVDSLDSLNILSRSKWKSCPVNGWVCSAPFTSILIKKWKTMQNIEDNSVFYSEMTMDYILLTEYLTNF